VPARYSRRVPVIKKNRPKLGGCKQAFGGPLGRVGKNAGIGNVRHRDRRALGEVRGIDFERHRAEVLDVAVGADQTRLNDGRDAILQIVLVSGRSELTHVVQDGLVLRRGPNLLECRDRHRGQEANDHDDDHDFHQGEALPGGVYSVHGYSELPAV
jgi:hypothetical protein